MSGMHRRRNRVGMIRGTAALGAAAFLIILSCRGGEPSRSGDIPLVMVSIPPQEYFVERIAGGRVEVDAALPPGASPATYEPGPAEMRQVAEADLYLSIGVPFESAWLPRLESANPDLPVVATHRGVDRRPIDRYGTRAEGEEHGHGHGHDHGSPDPHIWLSPELVRVQADTIAAALTRLDPAGDSAYAANLASFGGEIDSLQAGIRTVLEEARGDTFVVFHPSWGYFADEFDLYQLPIEVQGQEPAPSELARLMEVAERLSDPVVLVAPQFSRRSAETLAGEIGARLEEADPLARDWASNLRAVALRIAGSR